jgi:hypothetical protein
LPRVACSYCGLPTRVTPPAQGPVYCCSGCALASRLPPPGERPGGGIPLALVGVVIGGLMLFNQAFFGALAATLAADTREPAATWMARVSLGLGLVIGAGAAATLAVASVRRWTDLTALALALAIAVLGILLRHELVALLVTNVLLLGWLGRGWARRKIHVNPSLTV